MRIFKNTAIVWVLALLLGFTACEPEPTTIPDEDYRDDFIGTWLADDSPAKSTLNTYVVTISKDPSNSAQLLLNNFHQTQQNVSGLVSASRITISGFSTNAGSISGEGKLIGNNKIQWDYSVNDGADIIEYSAVFTRR
ncbi:MAG: hypothetical protein JEZ03_04110 [Bacteroidales bacterium]|nr:hypothetical protein [Bacteroidales bacterium]